MTLLLHPCPFMFRHFLLGTAAALLVWADCASPALAQPNALAATPDAKSIAVENDKPHTDPGREAPTPLPGWKMELVLQAPDLVHPSVVACAPDGRVFVAEDPMDIRAIPASAAHGRILCLHPDGRRTIFAQGLYAVFGMQYLDGHLYVLHNPCFSRFKDSGDEGVERFDLITSTLPEPWALDWNDHVPANFKLAMDGYFYVAVGDKGLYKCRGQDGSELNLHGGGVFRLKPDGTALEVFSSGVRNIMDVALLTDDDLFTYDNTDEQQWMSRLTYMMERGFYGYPFDFIPRQPHALWCMADYGGGAATGVLAYTEAAWGAEFVDNLFLADFGKRNLLRVKAQAEDGAFREVFREDLFVNPPADFRPVGITLSADGSAMFLCDWNHSDTKEDVAVGRLWKLSRQSNAQPPLFPEWLIPAAQNAPFKATNAELISALEHPAKFVRHVAQRRLSDRGKAVLPLLEQLMGEKNRSETAKIHALWAMHSIDKCRSSRRVIGEQLENLSQERLAAQIVRQLGQAKEATPEVVHMIERSMASGSLAVIRNAITAAGSLDAKELNGEAAFGLVSELPFIRHASVKAVRERASRDPTIWRDVLPLLTNSDPSNALASQSVKEVIRDNYNLQLIDALIAHVETSAERRKFSPRDNSGIAIEMLALLHQRTPEWKGEWWSYHPVNKAPPKKTETWEGTAKIEAAIRSALANDDIPTRIAAVKGVAEIGDKTAAPMLRKMLASEKHVGLLSAIVTSLGELRDVESDGAIAALIGAENISPSLQQAAVWAGAKLASDKVGAELEKVMNSAARIALWKGASSSLAAMNRSSAVPSLDRAAHYASSPNARGPANPELAEHLVTQIAKIDGEAAESTLLRIQAQGDELLRLAAVRAARLNGRKLDVPLLISLLEHPQFADEAARGLLAAADRRALSTYLKLLSDPQAELRDEAAAVIAKNAETFRVEIEKEINDVPPQAVMRLREIYKDDAQAKTGPIFTREISGVVTLSEYEAFAARNSGDAERGKAIFLDERGAGCHKCHSNQHAKILPDPLGPDLSTVGSQFSRAQLIEHVLHPSKSVREGYQSWQIVTESGEVFVGLPRGERDGFLLLVDRERRVHEIPLGEIEERTPGNISLMPADLQQGLSLESFADLIAFLESCKGAVTHGVSSGEAIKEQK